MLLFLLACDPYRGWPDPTTVFPHVYTPETTLEDYEQVRFETETWTPEEDGAELALYILKSQLHRPSAPAESLAHFTMMRGQIPPIGSGIRLSFGGDLMWAGDYAPDYAASVAGELEGLRVVNLETPTSPLHPTDQGSLGIYAFNADPTILDGLPFDVLQLNNNHSLDAGDAGLSATLEEVLARDRVPTGVDQHAQVDGVALLSYTWGLNQRDAETTHELFIVPFGHLGEPIDLTGIGADISAAKAKGADSVVVLLHWGFEYEYYPDPHFMVLAREIIGQGADLIVGEGPHVVQPPELCHVNNPDILPGMGACSLRTDDGVPRTAAVLYSLGNFATTMATLPCQVGIVATVSLDPDVTGLGWSGVMSVEEEGDRYVRPLHTMTDVDALEEAQRLALHLGDGWSR